MDNKRHSSIIQNETTFACKEPKKRTAVCATTSKDYKKLFEAVKFKFRKNYYSELLLKHKGNIKNIANT